MPKKTPINKNSTAKKTPTKKSAAQKTLVKKSASKKAPAKKALAKKSLARTSTAKKSPAKKSPVKVSASRKAPSKKAVTKKSVGNKSAAARSAPKSAPAAPVKASSSAADFGSAYTLPQLVKRTGGATVDEARALVAIPDAQLIAEGRQVATARINIDGARLYGQTLDILARATPKVKAALLGVTGNVMRVVIYSAQHGAELNAGRTLDQALQKARQTSRRATTNPALVRGDARRDQLCTLLKSLTADEEVWYGRIIAAYGTAKEPADLAQALSSLIALGEELISSADATQRAAQTESGLTSALLAELRGLAAEIALLGPAGQSSRELSAVSQSEVDLWDGINLILLERIVNLVNAAHELEPSIPRLIFISLRSYFSGGTRKPAAKPAPAAAAPAAV